VKLAAVLIDQQAFQDAVTELQEAAKYSPNYFPMSLNLGVAWRGLGNLDSALSEIQRAIQLRPTDADGHYQLEMTHIYRNDPVSAEKAMEAAVQADPKFIDPLMALADYFDGRNLYDQTVQYLLRAEKVEPKNPEILLKLAESYRKQEKFRQARLYYQKTLAVQKKSSDSYVGLGLLAEEDRQNVKAAEYYKQAQRIDPDDPRPYYYLGFLYREMNKRDMAVLAFRKYLKLDPQSKEKADIENAIYELTH
jgi:tetratricopeptide (TPR) repeat protein